ncbi:zinc finger and BTB domain-containing protein 24 [Eucyclogobius newberryi]|uniref:zinc finger and BTB domain-containing protein 24 n=1 Tax=Eucyclogobius newberryi TaxID=166745 RepID=UPI003B58E71C
MLLPLRSDKHELNVMRKCRQLWIGGLLCDVDIEVERRRFKAHRTLLAASSDYFYVLFTSPASAAHATLRMDDVPADSFASVISFIYSGQISVDEKDLEQLSAAAKRLEVNDLIEALARVTGERRAAAAGESATRKRGRPRKSAAGSERRDEGAATESDGRSGDESERRFLVESKRRIKLPLKYKHYTLGQEEAAKREKVKRGRKRKYPSTEARCDQCEKVFKSHIFLQIHQRTHTGEKPFRCSVCGHGFTQKHSLIVHQRAHTGERPFVCSVCSKALCTKNSLQDHMKLHEDKRSFRCDKCDRTFTQKRQLKSHSRVHTDKSLPECAECHHKFLDTAQLKKHLRTHTGEKPFTCEICGKCFTTKSTLQTHIRIHKGEKPYECPVCQKSFSDPSARRRHVASHLGKKPFSCSSCNLSFTRLDNLKSHAKTHNKEPPPSSRDEPHENILELQPFPGGAEEIQLVVSAENLNFVQDQSITLLAQNLPSLAVVAQGDQNLDQPEQMHVITLSKEAMEQLQVLPSVPGLAQGDEEQPGQGIHISSQSGQAISISQTNQQLTGSHIQGQTFQIQAGTVSYLYTTGLPQDG